MIEALGKLRAEKASPKLITFLNSESKEVQEVTITALALLRVESALPRIVQHLDIKYDHIRWAAILALSQLRAESAAPDILKYINDKEVSWTVIKNIGDLHAESAIPQLVQYLKDKNIGLQEQAIYTLGNLHADSASPAIVKCLYEFLYDEDLKVQQAAIKVLGDLRVKAAIPDLIKYLDLDSKHFIFQAAAYALLKMNYSSPKLVKWQEEKLKKATQQIDSGYDNKKIAAAQTLGHIYTQQAAELLSRLINNSNPAVTSSAIYSIGNIAAYHPEWFQEQKDRLLALTNHSHLELRVAALTALGRFISFRGDKKAADFPELDQKIHTVLRNIIASPQQKNCFRVTAIDALGKTNRHACAEDLYTLMTEQLTHPEDDALRSLCMLWLGRMKYKPAQAYIENELRKLEEAKAAWRMQRDQKRESDDESADTGDETEKVDMKEDAYWEHHEYRLATALTRIAPETTGIDLLRHPLYHVRQGAVYALGAKPTATRIAKIINAHQKFDPADLPSPFPYAAFQAIDLALWNLEYTGKQDDLPRLKDILANLKPCQVPGQEGAIKERLEWTIERLAENLAKNAELGQEAIETSPPPVPFSP